MNPQMVFFEKPFDQAASLVWGGESDTTFKLGENWQNAIGNSDSMVAIPIVQHGDSNALGILVLDDGPPDTDHRHLWAIQRMVTELASMLHGVAQEDLLRSTQSNLFQTRRLLASLNDPVFANPIDELEQLCKSLLTELKANYVDVCEMDEEGRFERLRKVGTGQLDKIGQEFSTFECRFRRQVASPERGTWLISNSIEEVPIVPRMVPDGTLTSKPDFATSVGRACGGGFEVSHVVLEDCCKTLRFKGTVREELFSKRKFFSTLSELRDFLRKAIQKSDRAEYLTKFIDYFSGKCVQRPYGVLSIGFNKQRILSLAELHMIDLAAGHAASLLARIQEHRRVMNSLEQAYRAIAKKVDLREGLVDFGNQMIHYLGACHGRIQIEQLVLEFDGKNDRTGDGHPNFQSHASFLREIGHPTKVDMRLIGKPGFVQFFRQRHGFDAAIDFETNFESSTDFEQYLGIPLSGIESTKDKIDINGCMEFWLEPGSQTLTTDIVQPCIEVAQSVAPGIFIAQGRDRSNKAKMREENLQIQVQQYRQINHDLKTPIAGIDLDVYKLKAMLKENGIDNPDIIKQIAEIDAGITHLTSLSEFLEKGKEITVNATVFSVGQWLRSYVAKANEIAASDKSEWPGVKINLDTNCDSVLVRFDEVHLERIMNNLIKNAYEANASNVFVETITAGENVSVIIADDGVGIAKDKLEQIWTPYVSTKGDDRGHGLSTVKALLHANMAWERTATVDDDDLTRIGFMTKRSV